MTDGLDEVFELPDGSLQGPNRVVYRRTPRRLKGRQAADLVSAGAPIVTSVYPDGTTWYDGAAAVQVWADIAPRLISGKRPPVRDLQWFGHIWESDAGDLLLYFDGEH